MTLYEKVYLPAFVKRCAECGITLSTEADLRSAFDSAAILKTSQGSSASAVLQGAVEALRKAAGLPNDARVDRQAVTEAAVKSVADDSAIRKALELLGRQRAKSRVPWLIPPSSSNTAWRM